MTYSCREATPEDLEILWAKNIKNNPDDARWIAWREEYIAINRTGRGKTFAVLCDGEPVGEGTLLFSPECRAISGRLALADGKTITNLNALRIEKAHEGQGHVSRLVRMMEAWAAEHGYTRLTIGVDACETRNIAIYLHWGYDEFVLASDEDDPAIPVLYYAKALK